MFLSISSVYFDSDSVFNIYKPLLNARGWKIDFSYLGSAISFILSESIPHSLN